jgi:hypothetical protein
MTTNGSEAHARRLLVIAGEGGDGLARAVEQRLEGRAAEVLVVAPAMPADRVHFWANDTVAAEHEAEERLTRSLVAIGARGFRARGQVGDPDPLLAVADALHGFAADEMLVATHAGPAMTWLERRLLAGLARFDVPATHVALAQAA